MLEEIGLKAMVRAAVSHILAVGSLWLPPLPFYIFGRVNLSDTIIFSLYVQPWPLFYRQHFVSRLASLPPIIRNKTTQMMLETLGDLKSQDPSIGTG